MFVQLDFIHQVEKGKGPAEICSKKTSQLCCKQTPGSNKHYTVQNSHNRNLKLGVGVGRKEYRLVLGALNNTIVVNIGNKQKHPAPYLETDTLTLGVG